MKSHFIVLISVIILNDSLVFSPTICLAGFQSTWWFQNLSQETLIFQWYWRRSQSNFWRGELQLLLSTPRPEFPEHLGCGCGGYLYLRSKIWPYLDEVMKNYQGHGLYTKIITATSLRVCFKLRWRSPICRIFILICILTSPWLWCSISCPHLIHLPVYQHL